MLSEQIDPGRGAHGEQHSGVALIVVEQQQQCGEQADADGHDPGDSRDGHAAIVTCMAVGQRIESSAESAPSDLVDMCADVRAAVLADPAGGLIAASEGLDAGPSRRLAGLAADLFGAADSALGDPAHQVEAQVDGGGVFAVRNARHTLACVTRRPVLPALVLYDLQSVLGDVERAA